MLNTKNRISDTPRTNVSQIRPSSEKVNKSLKAFRDAVHFATLL